MSPEEAAEVTDRPMTFLSVPFGFGPPAPHPTGLIQAELQQPQQGQGHHLHLEGAQHGLLSPRPAFFHAETLLMVTEAIFLAKTGRKRLHDLGGRQIQGRRHQEPELSVPRHRDDEDMHGNFRATDRPPAPQIFVPEQASPAIAPSPAGSPKGGPVYMVLRGQAAHPTSADDPSVGLGTPLGGTAGHPLAAASESLFSVSPNPGSGKVRLPSSRRRPHQTRPRSAHSTPQPLDATAPRPRPFWSERSRPPATGSSANTAVPHGADTPMGSLVPNRP